jgi:hypothetical protein
MSVAAPAARGGELVPLKGRNAGSIYVDSVDPVLGIAVVFADSHGESTLLGREFVRTTIIVDLASGAILSISATHYAANGDSYKTVEEIIAAPDPFTLILRATIVGGTGRFAGAQGNYENISRSDKPATPENLPFNVTNEWRGVISSPGANR